MVAVVEEDIEMMRLQVSLLMQRIPLRLVGHNDLGKKIWILSSGLVDDLTMPVVDYPEIALSWMT